MSYNKDPYLVQGLFLNQAKELMSESGIGSHQAVPQSGLLNFVHGLRQHPAYACDRNGVLSHTRWRRPD